MVTGVHGELGPPVGGAAESPELGHVLIQHRKMEELHAVGTRVKKLNAQVGLAARKQDHYRLSMEEWETPSME